MRDFLVSAFVSVCVVACAGASPSPPAPPSAVAAAAPSASSQDVVDASPETAASAIAEGPSAPLADAGVEAGTQSTSACNVQSPQDFLVRQNFLREGAEGIKRAIQYRTDTYGYFKGFGHAAADAQPPSHYAVETTFMGLPVKMHGKVVPALKCVEEEIKRSCADHPYQAHALAGIRFRNTYRGSEVTNHVYGIAIDIDPATNTCCGCVPPWNDAPACRRPAKTEYDRMAMPECWVHAFERYGFYWLGHDVLRDTMHFEFLGDPDRILKSSPN